MPTIILFRCRALSFDDLGTVCHAQVLDDVERFAVRGGRFLVLVGSAVPRAEADQAVEIAVRNGGYFLRLRSTDREAWIRRLVRTAFG